LTAHDETRRTERGSDWEEAREEMVEKRGGSSTSRGGILFDLSCRRTRAAEEHSAPPPARASPTANGTAVGISDIRSRDREAFLPLGMSLRR
jgi:hypothetical protein